MKTPRNGMKMMKISQSAFAKPPMSWLRNTSTITWNRMKIQRMNTKKMSIVQKKSRIGYELVASMGLLCCGERVEQYAGDGVPRGTPQPPKAQLPPDSYWCRTDLAMRI